MKSFFLYASSFALLTAMTSAHAAETSTPAPTAACVLHSYGDCCDVTLTKDNDALVQTGIVTGSMVDFLVIKDGGANECDFLFSGDMQVPMHAHHNSFNGTWVGGNLGLRYLNDNGGKGSCQLTLYYMNIANLTHFPNSCVGNKSISK